jgi:hypothetical protein
MGAVRWIKLDDGYYLNPDNGATIGVTSQSGVYSVIYSLGAQVNTITSMGTHSAVADAKAAANELADAMGSLDPSTLV